LLKALGFSWQALGLVFFGQLHKTQEDSPSRQRHSLLFPCPTIPISLHCWQGDDVGGYLPDLSMAAMLRHWARYFTDGAVI
jgi:hypothetical protein